MRPDDRLGVMDRPSEARRQGGQRAPRDSPVRWDELRTGSSPSGGIFAAILSTADSQLLVVASTLVRDVGEKILEIKALADEKRKLKVSRYVVVLSGVVALLLAFLAEDLVFWLVLFAWGGLGASLGPPLVLALYWRRTTRLGVIAGMVTGALTTIGWKLWLKEVTGIYELIPAFGGSLLAVVVFSLVSRPPPAPDLGTRLSEEDSPDA